MKYSWTLHATNEQTDELVKDLVTIALSYHEKLGITPTVTGIEGKGYSSRIMSFKKGYQKLTENGFKDVMGMSLYTEESETMDFAFYWKVMMDISFSNITGFTMYAGVDMDVAGKDQVLHEAILPICKLLNVTYGYSFVMPAEKGPSSYGTGYIHVPEGHELSDEEEMLLIKGSPYIRLIHGGQGILRDVYQENLLTDVQLNASVDGNSLRDWILSDPSHGILSDISGKPYWKVNKDNLVQVRNVLHKNGLLLAFDEKIIPGLI